MGKHTQKRKKRNANKDFQKVKLKPGRRLQKATNDVSNASFKSKKIQLLPQFGKFSSSTYEPDDELSRALKDLNHHNARTQVSALNKIRGLVDQSLSSQKYDAVMTKVLWLLSATKCDHKVRNEAMSFIKWLLESSSSLQLKGCMNIIETYTSLAMTHVSDEVRHDSLKLFELLLDLCSDFICGSTKLVCMFWELITCSNPLDDLRVLRVVPLSDKMSVWEWRMYVLKLFIKLLDINVSQLRRNEVCNKVESQCLDDSKRPFIVNSMNNGSIVSFPNDHNVIVLWENEPFKLHCFLSDLVRVLIMTFEEASDRSNKSYFLEAGSMKDSNEFLQSVVKCFSSYAEWVSMLEKIDQYKEMVGEIKDSISERMQSCLFSAFPVMNERAIISHTRSAMLSNDKYIMLNLDLCEVFSLLVLNSARCSSFYVNCILAFLMTEIKSRDQDVVKKIFKVLKFFLLCHNVDKDMCEPHLRAFLENIECESKLSVYRRLVSEFFLDLSVDDNFLELKHSNAMKMWLRQLPNEFLAAVCNDGIDEEYVKKIMHIEIAVLPTFLDGLQEVSPKYFDLLRSQNKHVRSAAVILIANLKTVTDRDFCHLFSLSRDPSVSVKLIYQLMIRWEDRFFDCWGNTGFKLNSYKSFLLNVAIGMYLNSNDPVLKETEEIFDAVYNAVPSLLPVYKIIPTLSKQRQGELTNHALHLLKHLSRRNKISCSVQNILTILLSKTDHIPVFAAMAAVKLYYTFLKDNLSLQQDITSLSKKINELTVDLFLFEIGLIKTGLDDDELEQYSIMKELSPLPFDFGGILDVMLSRLEFIEYIEDTSYYGNIIWEISERCALSPEDAPRMTALLKGLKTVFGRDLLKQTWYEELFSHPAD